MHISKSALATTAISIAATLAVGVASVELTGWILTGSGNPYNLVIRNEFNNFAKADGNRHLKGFDSVSNFVNANGEGNLIATKDGNTWDFEYIRGKMYVPNNQKKETLRNWDAVKKFLEISKHGEVTLSATDSSSGSSSENAKTMSDGFENYISIASKDMDRCIPDISSILLAAQEEFNELDDKVPLELTLLKILDRRIKPMSKIYTQLKYAQAVLIFRGWVEGIYLPIHEKTIDDDLISQGMECSHENRLNEAITRLRWSTYSSDDSEIGVFGFTIDSLADGLSRLHSMGHEIVSVSYGANADNGRVVSHFKTPNNAGMLEAVNKDDHWVFVCELNEVESAAPVLE